MNKLLTAIVSFLIIASLCGWGSSGTLGRWEEFSRSKDRPLFMKWLRDSALAIKRKDIAPVLPISVPPVYGSAGLFITLVKDGKVRGCFGAFDHSETDITVMLRDYLKGALSYDPRYKPIELHELDEAEIIITVASYPEQVEALNKVDIRLFGVLIECDGAEGTVIVPAEFRTASRLNKDNRYTNCRISSFRAVTIREEQ